MFFYINFKIQCVISESVSEIYRKKGESKCKVRLRLNYLQYFALGLGELPLTKSQNLSSPDLLLMCYLFFPMVTFASFWTFLARLQFIVCSRDLSFG